MLARKKAPPMALNFTRMPSTRQAPIVTSDQLTNLSALQSRVGVMPPESRCRSAPVRGSSQFDSSLAPIAAASRIHSACWAASARRPLEISSRIKGTRAASGELSISQRRASSERYSPRTIILSAAYASSSSSAASRKRLASAIETSSSGTSFCRSSSRRCQPATTLAFQAERASSMDRLSIVPSVSDQLPVWGRSDW